MSKRSCCHIPIFDTVKKAQASLCKRADSQEPLLPAQEILIFITLSSDFACRNPKFGVVIPLGMAEWCIPF